VLQRIQELHRPHQVRRDPLDQQSALAQRLLHQREVEHLQVAQTPVDQLARPARRTAGEIAHLDQAGGQAAGHGVEGRTGADHPASDDHDIQFRGGCHRFQRGLTGRG
jgi:hypothetical protein